LEVVQNLLAVQGVLEVFEGHHFIPDGTDTGLDGEVLEGHADGQQSFESLCAHISVMHRFGVVKGEHDVVVALTGLSSSKPYAIFSEIGGNEWNYFLEVELFASFEVSSIFSVVHRLKNAL